MAKKQTSPDELFDESEEPTFAEPTTIQQVAENTIKKACELILGNGCYMLARIGNSFKISSYGSYEEKENLLQYLQERNFETKKEENAIHVQIAG